MKLELEVLVSSSIKRKKPWPKLAFIGEADESVFLLDNKRISVLYLPSGQTKKKIPKIHSLISEAVIITHSDNGHFILGLMQSGDLFLWHKDTDLLKFIPGINDLTQFIQSNNSASTNSESTPTNTVKHTFQLFLADDGCKILVVIDNCHIYIWELDPESEIFHTPTNSLKGSWFQVVPPTGTILPQPENIECSLHGVFMISETINGLCCELSFVFNNFGSVCITSLILMWCDVQNVFTYRNPTFTAQWNTIVYPLDSVIPGGQPIRVPGSYVTRHSHDGNLLAVAVNQLDTYKNRMMFVSVWTDTVVVVDMKGMGTKKPLTKNASSHWVSDINWTADDLFVICITHQGSLCILTRLGEPLMLQTHGCNIEMGPKPYLPLHPLISVRTEEDDSVPQSEAAAYMSYQHEADDPLRQHFSVAVHPRLPMVLISDGFMVTALQLPTDITCLTMMKGLTKDSSHHLSKVRDQKKVKMTFFDGKKLRIVNGQIIRRIGLQPDGKRKNGSYEHTSKKSVSKRYVFEEEEGDTGLDTTQDSDIAEFILAGELNIGKITFGDVENLNATMDFVRLTEDDDLSVAEHLVRAQQDMMLAWNLGVSHVGLWTSDHEDTCQHIIQNMMHLFTLLMHADSKTLRQIDALQKSTSKKAKTKDKGKKRALEKVLGMFKQMIKMIHIDATSQHMMVCALGLIQCMIDFLLKDKTLKKKQSRLTMLRSCYLLLKYCDTLLGKAYSYLPGSHHHGPLSLLLSRTTSLDFYSPSILTDFISTEKLWTLQKQLNEHRDKHQEVIDVDDDGYSSQPSARSVEEESDKLIIAGFLQEKQTRLLPIWQLLYKTTTKHYQSLVSQCEPNLETEDIIQKELQKTVHLIQLLQHVIHSLGGQTEIRQKHKLLLGDKFYIESSVTDAVDSWIKLLETMPSNKLEGSLGSRVFHSLFYALVLSDRLREAVMLVRSMVWQNDLRQSINVCKHDSGGNALLAAAIPQKFLQVDVSKPVSMVTSKPAQQLVQTLGRFMAAYFSNSSLFVYPPHAPKRLPPLHLKNIPKNTRVVPLYHDKLTSLIREHELDEIWTPEGALEYLMISGLYTEAVWFVHQLGDWKTTFIMSVAAEMHQKLKPEIYKNKKLSLPEELTPEYIMKSHLKSAFLLSEKDVHLHIDEATDFDQLTCVLRDVLLAAVVCNVELVSLLLLGLLDRLKSLASQFTVLVPEEFYLPAPPIYCPQPASTVQESLSPEALEEVELRKQISSVFHLILLVLNSSGVTQPVASWYAQKVVEAVDKGQKLKKNGWVSTVPDIKVLQEEYLREPSCFQGYELNSSVNVVLSCFRELCSMAWMLYVRDKLCLCLRDKAKMAEKKLNKPGGITNEQWREQCEVAMNWTKQLLPFSTFLNGDADLYGCLLSLILELPPTADTAKIMAEHFSHPETKDPEIQEKIHWILKEWQGVFLRNTGSHHCIERKGHMKVNSPRGVTMSLFFNSNIDRAERMAKRRKKLFGGCETQVFRDKCNETKPQKTIPVGSRYFECTQEYLAFLDIFYAVSFSRNAADDKEKQAMAQSDRPLLIQFSELHRENELESSVASVRSKNQKSHICSMIVVDPPAGKRRTSSCINRAAGTLFNILPEECRAKDVFRFGMERNSISGKSTVSSNTEESEGDYSKNKYKKSNNADVTAPSQEVCDTSMHMSDLDDEFTGDMKCKDIPDLLVGPLIPAKMLDSLKLDKRFTHMVELLDWLTQWAGRNHTLLTHNTVAATDLKAAIRVSVPPKMIMYSLWLLEACYNPPPSVTTLRQPEHLQEVTVAMACCSPTQEKGDNHDPKKNDKKKKRKKREKKNKKDIDAVDGFCHLPEDALNNTGSTERFHTNEDVPNYDLQHSESRSEGTPKVLSFNLSDNHNDDQKSIGATTDSTETLCVSSLKDEELKQTVEETICKLQSRSLHMEDLDSGIRGQQTSSVDVFLNTTLRFPNENSQRQQRQHHSGWGREQMQNKQRTETQSAAIMTTTQSSDMSNVAQELQGIVRQELRKIMEAQHRGILAMLGALDGDDSGTGKLNDTQSRSSFNPNSAPGKADKGHLHKPSRGQSKNSHPDKEFGSPPSSSEVDVTPLSSDEMLLDKPLTVSQLGSNVNQGSRGSQQFSTARKRADLGLNHALKQLKLLEANQRGSAAMDQQGSCSKSQPDTNQENHQLFQIDLELPGQRPQLLRIPSPPSSQHVHLPHIPQQAWSEGGMPHPVSSYGLQDIPEKDTSPRIPVSEGVGLPSILNNIPFPLLTIGQPSCGPPSFGPSPVAIPRLIPPEQIISYEEREYKTNVLRAQQIFEFVNEQMAQQMAAQKQPELVGKRLLKPDVFEPFGPADERDKKQRERHRKKKLTASSKSDKAKTDKYMTATMARSRSRSSQENESTASSPTRGTESDLQKEVASDLAKLIDDDRQQSQKSTDKQKLDDTDDDMVLNHGYALTPGLFDDYLKKGEELGLGTNAYAQYKAATGVQTTPRDKKDACTLTSLSDKERSLSQNEDPVSDAIKKYYEAKTGHTSTILSPDVFLALHFDGKTSDTEGSQPARAFLNVVDINADIFDDIVSAVQEKKGAKDVTQRTEFKLPSQRIEALNQEAHETNQEKGVMEGPDPTTARLLGRPASPVDPLTAESVMYMSRRQRTREDIQRKLENMNSQFSAIESMNATIERDFKDSELLLHTIEKMSESLTAEQRAASPSHQQQQPFTPDHEVSEECLEQKSSPSRQKKVHISDVSPRKEEQVEGDTGDEQALRKSGQSDLDQSSQKMDLSGLSGVSDILGEILLRGDMTAEQLGLSQKQADHLTDRARISSVHLSQEQLQQIFRKQTSTDKPQNEEQIKELHQWMAEKQRERLKQYKEQLNQLRSAEHHPYKPLQEIPSERAAKKAEKERLEMKKQQNEEYIKRREEEAARLMGDILADLSNVPLITSPVTTPRKGKDMKKTIPKTDQKTSKRSGKGMLGKTVVRKIFKSPTRQSPSRSPVRERFDNTHDDDQMDVALDDYMQMWAGRSREQIDSGTKVIHPRDYHDNMETTDQSLGRTRPMSAPATPPRARKQKKLTDLVRLQRPEVTRQNCRNKPLTYTERLANLQSGSSTARTTSTVRDQQRLYGTKRLPGSARLADRRAPRVVKTYTERLAELRHHGQRPASAGSRLQNIQQRGISPRKPGRTLTYTEQLQQLQPPKGTARSSTESVKPQPKPGYKWHKAPHKPKTYVEQLQELQKPATIKPRGTYRITESKVYRSPPVHGAVRSRPYGDPYTEAVDDDRVSVVSPWEMEDDIKKLLYEEDGIMERLGGVTSDGDVSEMSEIEYYIGDEPEHYTDLVDVGELAEIASISEASVMSFIDWDQVDQLIAEA